MAVTASQLRQNVYRLLDRVLETGEPLEIERKGRRLRIERQDRHEPSKLERIPVDPSLIVGDPDELVHVDWSEHWDPEPL